MDENPLMLASLIAMSCGRDGCPDVQVVDLREETVFSLGRKRIAHLEESHPELLGQRTGGAR